jgi:hypothetical protein
MSYFDRFTPEHWDHERDLRKHEPRPTDRLTPPIATALEVAIMVKGLKDIREAEKLVEQYAQTVAAGARLEGVIEGSERVLQSIEQHSRVPL